MKIIFCLNHYLPQHIAGTEVYVAALAKECAAKGWECKVLIPHYGSTETVTYFFEGVPVIRYAEPSLPDRALMTGSKAPEGLQHFTAILKAEAPQIVHFHELAGSNGISLYHVKAAKVAGFKTAMTFHIAKYSCATGTLMYMNETPCDGVIRYMRCSKCRLNNMGITGWKAALLTAGFGITNALNYDITKWNNSLGTALGMPFLIRRLKKDLHSLQENTDAQVVLTRWYRDVLLKNELNEDRLHFIPQALPNKPLSIPESEQESSRLRIIFVGRINHFKGVLTMINAVKVLDASRVSLHIYGKTDEPGYGAQCEAAAAGNDNIKFKGTVLPENIISTISAYDLLCLPSEVCEMAPLVIQEAFAAGVPVLASDVYGNAEAVTAGKDGWLFTFKNQQHLQQQIQSLVSNPEKIKKAAQQINPPQDFTYVSEQHRALYEKMLH